MQEDNRLKLTADDLEEWRAHPVTQEIMGLFKKDNENARNSYKEMFWHTGEIDAKMIGFINGHSHLIDDLTQTSIEAIESLAEKLS